MKRRLITLFAIVIVFATAQRVRAEEIEVPRDVIKASEEIGGAYGICPETLQAMCYVESTFQPDAENGGCVGIMQVSTKWHKDRMRRLGVTDLKDMRQNMLVAADYLSELAEDGEDLEIALMKYHGETDIYNRLDAGETSWYVEKVLSISAELERQHKK